MTLRNQIAAILTRWASRLASVTAYDPGKDNDGLIELYAGGPADRPWDERRQQFTDALAAWRSNPLARRVITLITSFVVGDGITLRAEYGPLQRYLTAWWQHPQNLLDLRLTPWCEELSRAGELFIALHFNPADGISYCRLVPAASIDAITWAPGDYEQELTYHEAVGLGDPDYDKGGRTWYAPDPAESVNPAESVSYRPIMLHFAVNRPAGCVRGDSDLATILTWLQYYAAWLSDRVKLNEAVRAFLWIVKVTGTNVDTRKRQLKNKPEPGTVQVIDKDNEDWQAVAPNLNANDAAQDGRAIRWMIAAGGPGVSLVDFGESETANLATATAMAEQRNKFMKTRQAYFGYVLSRLAVESYNRAVRLGRVRGKPQDVHDIAPAFSDVSAADNASLAAAANQIAATMQTLQGILGPAKAAANGSAFQRLALRLILRFAGEQPTAAELDALLAEATAGVSEQ